MKAEEKVTSLLEGLEAGRSSLEVRLGWRAKEGTR